MDILINSIAKAIQEYSNDYEKAIERSKDIEAMERERAARAGEELQILRDFGPV